MKKRTIIFRTILILLPFVLFCVMGFMISYSFRMQLDMGAMGSGRSAGIGFISIFLIRFFLILNLLMIIKGFLDKKKKAIPVFKDVIGIVLFSLCFVATILMFYTDWLNFTAFIQWIFVIGSMPGLDVRSLPIFLSLMMIAFGVWDIRRACKISVDREE